MGWSGGSESSGPARRLFERAGASMSTDDETSMPSQTGSEGRLGGEAPTLPDVDLPGADVAHDVTYKQIREQFIAAQPHTFFASGDGSHLVEPGALGIKPVTPIRFATAVQQHMRFLRRTKRTASYAELPDLTARRMINHPPRGHWPVLRGVARHPVLLPNGRLVTAPGYDPGAEWFIDWPCPPVNTALVSSAVAQRVWDLLLDFNFADESSRWYAMAMFIQPFVRPAVAGPTPLYLVGGEGAAADGEVEGSDAGKTFLAQVAGYAALGRQPPMMKLSEWGSEGERQLVGVVAQEPEMILLDNLSTGTVLGGGLLHQLLTAYESTFVRSVGEPVREVPVRMLWVASGNGIGLDGEQARRTVLIRLEPRDLVARPYRTPKLLERVRRPGFRRIVASVVCKMIEDWIAAGRPAPPRSLSSFGGWSDVVGGIVCHYGGAKAEDAWLARASRPRSAGSDEVERLFVAWPLDEGGRGKKPLPASAVLPLLDPVSFPLLDKKVNGGLSPRARAIAMGRVLQGLTGRAAGGWLLRTGTSRGKTRWYRPELVGPAAPDPEVAPEAGGIGRDTASPLSLTKTSMIPVPGGIGGMGGIAQGRIWGNGGSSRVRVGLGRGYPSNTSNTPIPMISMGCGGGSDPASILPIPPGCHEGRWREEVEAIKGRGVRVDPELWIGAVRELRRAMRDSADPATQHRLEALNTYAEEIHGQALLDPEQRVRATWYPMGTWSGRITARRPPLQSITKQGELRAAVVPAPGCGFVVGDWSQSQLRIAFGLSGDPAGAAACAPGRDLHAEIGQAVAPGHPEARSLGKLLNFAILYLAGPDALVEGAAGRGIDLTRPEAHRLIRRLESSFPALCRWRRAQEGREDFVVRWGGEDRQTVTLPPRAFDSETGRPRLPAVLAGIIQAHEAEALHHVLEHTEARLGVPFGYRPVLLVHDEVVWEGPSDTAQTARTAAEQLMVEALEGVTSGVPAVAAVEVRGSWAAPSRNSYTEDTHTPYSPPCNPVTVGFVPG